MRPLAMDNRCEFLHTAYHANGVVSVWELDQLDPDAPPLPSQLFDAGGSIESMIQIADNVIWAGYRDGRLLAWNIAEQRPFPPDLQPISEDHPLTHRIRINALLCHFDPLNLVQTPVIWSISQDQTLRRFFNFRS